MKTKRAALAVGLATLTAAASVSLAAPASASILYQNINYSGATLGQDYERNLANVGFNNITSSIRHFGYYVYIYDGSYYSGNGHGGSYDYSDLRSLNRGLGGNWNDQISSFRR